MSFTYVLYWTTMGFIDLCPATTLPSEFRTSIPSQVLVWLGAVTECNSPLTMNVRIRVYDEWGAYGVDIPSVGPRCSHGPHNHRLVQNFRQRYDNHPMIIITPVL